MNKSYEKKSHRCIVPLRVPMVALTEHCSRAVPRSFNCKAIVSQMHYIYHRCRYYQLQVSKYYAYSY